MTAKKKVSKQSLTFVNLDQVTVGDHDPAQYQRIDGKWKVALGAGAWASVADPAMIRELNKLAEARIQAGSVQVTQHRDGSTAVQSKEEIEFKALAQEIVEDTLKVGQKWFNLCKFIRAHKIGPKDSTKWLLDLGFHKSKASEVNRVAQAPDEVFSQYEARLIGWRGVLQLSRGSLAELKQADVVEEDKELQAALNEVEAELSVEEEAAEEAAKLAESDPEAAALERKREMRKRLVKAGVQLLALAAKLESKPRKWNTGNGYILTLAKGSKPLTKEEAAANKK